jgi:hypothetical protein
VLEAILLTVPPGVAPRTKAGDWGIVMLHSSGSNKEIQWFDYKPSIYDSKVRAEWPLGTMMATVPHDTAEVLVEHGYARVMTLEEAKTYNKGADKLRVEGGEVRLNVG